MYTLFKKSFLKKLIGSIHLSFSSFLLIWRKCSSKNNIFALNLRFSFEILFISFFKFNSTFMDEQFAKAHGMSFQREQLKGLQEVLKKQKLKDNWLYFLRCGSWFQDAFQASRPMKRKTTINHMLIIKHTSVIRNLPYYLTWLVVNHWFLHLKLYPA